MLCRAESRHRDVSSQQSCTQLQLQQLHYFIQASSYKQALIKHCSGWLPAPQPFPWPQHQANTGKFPGAYLSARVLARQRTHVQDKKSTWTLSPGLRAAAKPLLCRKGSHIPQSVLLQVISFSGSNCSRGAERPKTASQ